MTRNPRCLDGMPKALKDQMTVHSKNSILSQAERKSSALQVPRARVLGVRHYLRRNEEW